MSSPSPELINLSRNLQDIAREVDRMIRNFAGKEMGFALLVFEFDKQGRMEYISNATRETMLKAMLEFVHKNIETLESGGPFPPASYKIS